MLEEVTVILNSCKRIEYLQEQISAVKWQTIKAKEIMLWNNWWDLTWINLHWIIVSDNNKNFWVWSRFIYWLNAKTKYVCFIDDDTIPASSWIENCLNESKDTRGVYWAIGHKYGSRENRNEKQIRIWWHWINNEKTEQVDIVWHSRFIEREFLNYYFIDNPPIKDYPYNWEDIWLSYSVQKHLWLWTYVPPHPKENMEMWWCIPSKWEKYWNDENANYVWKQELYNEFYKSILDKWFKLLIDK